MKSDMSFEQNFLEHLGTAVCILTVNKERPHNPLYNVSQTNITKPKNSLWKVKLGSLIFTTEIEH